MCLQSWKAAGICDPYGPLMKTYPVSLLQTDNTAGVYARRGGFSRQKQDFYLLPIVISDGGIPPMSSTNTLTIKVCGCDVNGALLSCNAEAYILNAGLSTGALIAILACIVILLGKDFPVTWYNQWTSFEWFIWYRVVPRTVLCIFTELKTNKVWQLSWILLHNG